MDEAELRHFDIHLPPVRVHYDFRPIKIRVFRNGDELDIGKEVTVTRREFKHWIIFLDVLTKRLGTTTAINRLYTVHGERIDHFDDLQPRCEYVAVEKGGFIHCSYGRARRDTGIEKKWTSTLKLDESKPAFLNSAETMDIYLKHEGYGTYTGLPYPFDSILAKSPSASALHIQSHAHAEKFGGSLEKLNMVGTYHWDQEPKAKGTGKQIVTSGGIHLPKLVGLSDSFSVKSGEKHAQFEPLSLPGLESNALQKKQPNSEDQNEPNDVGEVLNETKEENKKPEEKPKAEVASLKKEKSLEKKEKDKKIKKTTVSRSTSIERKKDDRKRDDSKERTENRVVEKAETDEENPGNIIVPYLLPGKNKTELSTAKNQTNRSANNVFGGDQVKRGPGVEKIFERTEKRIIRELSDDVDFVYKPRRDLVQSTSTYKTYTWEAKRPYDPDLDF